jgi:outer membrane protein insertion porin family/translocation and assembly module TamA
MLSSPLPGSFERVAWSLRVAAAIVAFCTLFATFGCASLPKGATAVDKVRIEGADKVDDSDIEEKIATRPSPKFLMLFRGVVYDYELFDRFVLQRDLARVERFYQARGYYDAHARAGRVEHVSEQHVRVTIDVDEGEPIKVSDVFLAGLDELPPAVVEAAKKAATAKLRRGKIFDEDDYADTDRDLKRALTDRGFAYALTSRRAEIDLVKHEAKVSFEVFPGPPSRFGGITIEGLGRLPEGPVRRALDIKHGETYSTQTIDDAQQAVLDLGVFSSVEITPQLPDPPPPDAIVPLHVKVEQSKLHQVTLGGGVEFDPIKTDVHGIIGWENRNFLGGFRRFRVQLKPGIVLYPTRFQTPIDAPTDYLPEERLRVELHQPGFLEARTNGVLSSEVNTYPLLLTPHDAERGPPVLGYFEYKGTAGIDRTWWKLYGFPSYNLQTNTPFAYLGDRDKNLGTIVVSSIDLRATLDFRDDKVHPHKGLYLLNDFSFAGLGGDARDLRIQPDLRGYIPLARKLTIALRASVGFLFPFNYGAVDPSTIPAGDTPEAQAARKEAIKETQLGFLRGFFSGGPSSNRGYPLRGVGPHGIILFYNPGVQADVISRDCEPLGTGNKPNPNYSAARCSLPLGGFTLAEASAEFRFDISGPLAGATFCDASDVSSHQANFSRLKKAEFLHMACGAGARYDTPVGPIRLDIGVRIPGLNPDFDNPEVRQAEGDPGTILGLPVAVAFGIGEAF